MPGPKEVGITPTNIHEFQTKFAPLLRAGQEAFKTMDLDPTLSEIMDELKSIKKAIGVGNPSIIITGKQAINEYRDLITKEK